MSISHVIDSTEDGVATVTFTDSETGIVHTRGVHVSDCADDAAIAQRISEVASGVANKIQVGAITAPVEEESEE